MPEGVKTMKSVYETIDFKSTNGRDIERKMEELRSKGWKNISFNTYGMYRDSLSEGCWIRCKRPLTKMEIGSAKRAYIREQKKEITLLKKLAKRYGYTLIPFGKNKEEL